MADQKSDLINPAYWVGHAVVIIATVVGVFLAASVGFKKAVDLELLTADRGTYYVAESLLAETQGNLAHFDEYLEKTKGKNFITKSDLSGMRLNSFIFESAKFSDSTFEMKPSVLNEVSQYYSVIGTIFATQSENPHTKLQEIRKANVEFRDGPLQRLEEHVQELRELVESQGIKL